MGETRRFRPFDGRAEPTGPAESGHSPALRRSPRPTACGDPCRSRYDPPGRVGPDDRPGAPHCAAPRPTSQTPVAV